MEYPFCQSRSAVLALSPHNFLHTPSLITVGGRVGKIKSNDTVQTLLNNSQNSVINSVLVINRKHNTVWTAMNKINSIPSRSRASLKNHYSDSNSKATKVYGIVHTQQCCSHWCFLLLHSTRTWSSCYLAEAPWFTLSRPTCQPESDHNSLIISLLISKLVLLIIPRQSCDCIFSRLFQLHSQLKKKKKEKKIKLISHYSTVKTFTWHNTLSGLPYTNIFCVEFIAALKH